jgi:hypothetical protein
MKWLVIAAILCATLINWANHRTLAATRQLCKAIMAMAADNLGCLGAWLIWLALAVMLWFVLPGNSLTGYP